VRYRPGKSNANADALSRAFDKGVTTLTIAAIAGEPNQIPASISKDEWVSAQLDSEFGDLYRYIQSRQLPPECEKAQLVISEISSYTIVDRVLYYVDPHTAEMRLAVPTKYQDVLFHERHGGVCGVH